MNTRVLAAVVLAACGRTPPPPPVTPAAPEPVASPSAPTGPVIDNRKQFVARTADALPWSGDTAPITTGVMMVKLSAGASRSIARSHAVVVAGTINGLPAGSYLSATSMTCSGGECIAFVHEVPDAAPAEKRAPVERAWGDPNAGPHGVFVTVKAGTASQWRIQRHDFHGVVIAGTVHAFESGTQPTDLPVGSYWWQPGGNKHTINCKAGGPDCVVYLDMAGKHDLLPL